MRVAKDIKISRHRWCSTSRPISFNVMNSDTELGRTRQLNSAAFGQLNEILSPRILRIRRVKFKF